MVRSRARRPVAPPHAVRPPHPHPSGATPPDVPADLVPRHVAIVMDGNGRWAKQRMLPRVAGHRRGLESVRAVTRGCIEAGVEYLTLFAFSSENWRRPRCSRG